MYDVHFKRIDSKFTEALERYNQGLPYAHKLPDERYKRYLLNGGVVHAAEGKFKEALNIYRDVRVTFSGLPSDSSTLELYGRSLLGENEALLDLIVYADSQGIDLDQTLIDLSRTTSIFNLSGSHARHTIAYADLALAHTLNGSDRESQVSLDHALLIIDQHGLRRERIYLLYHRALIHFLNQEYAKALSDIAEALSLSKRYSIAEFDVRLLYLQAQTHEEAGDFTEASEAYSDTADAAEESAYGRDQLLFRPSSNAFRRVQAKLPKGAEPSTFLTLGFYGVVALVLAFFALLAFFTWMALHRKKKEQPASQTASAAALDTAPPPVPDAAPSPEGASAPAEPSATTEPLPTVPDKSLSFDVLAAEIGLDRTGFETSRRYVETIYHIRSDPGSFRRAIEHPTATERLDRLDRGLGKRQDLFACVEAWEEEHNDAVFSSAKAGNTVATTLRDAFTALEIDWPQSLREWDDLLQLK